MKAAMPRPGFALGQLRAWAIGTTQSSRSHSATLIGRAIPAPFLLFAHGYSNGPEVHTGGGEYHLLHFVGDTGLKKFFAVGRLTRGAINFPGADVVRTSTTTLTSPAYCFLKPL